MNKSIEILTELVAEPTISSATNLPCLDRIANRLDGLGARIELLKDETGTKGNLWVRFGPDVAGGLLLSGHTDVVPVVGQPWQSDPFSLKAGQQHNGEDILVGRGSCDMKGFIAVVLDLLSDVPLQHLKAPLTLAFTYDEEVGCRGAQRMVQQLRDRNAPLPRYALVGEPTSMQTVRFHKGHLQFCIELTGVSGHSSKPKLGVNAIDYAGKAIAFLGALAARRAQNRSYENVFMEYPHPIINIGTIRGGSAVNVIPEHCTFEAGYRFMPNEDPQDFLDEVEAYLVHELRPMMKKENGAADAQLIATVRPLGMDTPSDSELEMAIAEVTGGNAPVGVEFTTEGGTFNSAGMQAIVCGPGSIDQAHKANEFISISQLAACRAMLQQLMGRFYG